MKVNDAAREQLPEWCTLNSPGLSAFKAECCALVVALWLGVSVTQGTAFSVYSDCQSALDIARGDTVAHADGIATILGHVAGCCRAASTAELSLSYSPGHAGVLGNEIADVTAKAAALGIAMGSIVWQLPTEPSWWSGHGFLWSWAAVCRWPQEIDVSS